MTEYRFIDADTHVNEPADVWQARVPARLRERAPKMIEVDDGKGGHKHTSELARWDQVWTKPWKANEEQALAELALVGVRAAVLTHQDEVGKWFTWPVEWPIIAGLIQQGRLVRPGPGWLAVP